MKTSKYFFKTLLLASLLLLGLYILLNLYTKSLGDLGEYKPFDKAHDDKFSLGDFDDPYLIKIAKKYNRYSNNFSSITVNGKKYRVRKTDYQNETYLGILDMTLADWKALPRNDITVSLTLVLPKGGGGDGGNGSDSSGTPKQFNLNAFFKKVVRTGANEIYSWRDLQNIKHDLAGDYQQMNDIVFPTPNTKGFPEEGFEPLGYLGYSHDSFEDNDFFTGSYNGKGLKIKDLFIRRRQASVGLFGGTEDANLENIALLGSKVINIGNSREGSITGGVVGIQVGGIIANSYANGAVTGGDGEKINATGGLVGEQREKAIITNSYASGSVAGGDARNIRFPAGLSRNISSTGGLVGHQGVNSTIVVSYSTSSVVGGNSGNISNTGGLVGRQWGYITDSHTTGDVTGGNGEGIFTGGLVGDQLGVITGSYATGWVIGGNAGDYSFTGGLVGHQSGLVTASYATGSVIGGNAGDDSHTGGLVGYQLLGTHHRKLCCWFGYWG